jgi:hypothetical protein
MSTVEEETDESIYWMELLVEGCIVPEDAIAPLGKEAGEILAITVSSIRTARARQSCKAHVLP